MVKHPIYRLYIKFKRISVTLGRCDGACAVTCTADGRKYDDLAGVGGVRGTCLDDNYMCTASDPYGKTYSVLVHEFAHTIHQYSLPHVPGDWWNRVSSFETGDELKHKPLLSLTFCRPS